MNQNIELGNLEIYKKIVEHINESLWIGDKNNDTIYTNTIFCEMLGYSVEEIIGKNYCTFFNTENIEIIKKINTEKKGKIKYEATIKAKNGNLIPVLCSGTPTENGGTVLMISNLSELNSLKEAKENLIKINKTKDEFISIVGHELRTPLTSIRGYLSMILDGDMGKINSEIKKSLGHSYDSSVRLIQLVNDVLSIGKIESGKMEYHVSNIQIKELIDSVYKDIHLEMEEQSINFKIKFDQKLINTSINIDESKLKQVFLNLLTNAIKFNNINGSIIFQITKIEEKIRFEIIDTGVGIAEEGIKKLFSKFSQIESSLQRQNTSGLGLGLAICKKFVEAFNSEVKVKSKLGEGSNFYFDLDIK